VGGYDAEIRHILDAVAAAREHQAFQLRATLADALAVADILEAERQSQTKGGCQAV
jgi:predicted dehydrogenase